MSQKFVPKVSESNMDLSELGINRDVFLLPKIYQKNEHDPYYDYGPFLQKNETGELVLFVHDIERGTIDTLKENGELNDIEIQYFGTPYFTLDPLRKGSKPLIQFTPKALPKSEIKPCKEAFKKTVKLAEQCLEILQTKVNQLGPKNVLKEEDVFNYISAFASTHDVDLLHVVIHTDHLYPRSYDPQKCMDSKHPILKMDIGFRYQKESDFGIADISRTFFMPKQHIDPTTYDRYDKVCKLYNITQKMVENIATYIKIGMTGDDIFNYAVNQFNDFVIPNLLSHQIIEKPVPLTRNVGHWVDDHVEGTPFLNGTTREIREGDILCIECPLGTKSLDISVNYEIQGTILPTGFHRFEL